MRGDDLAVADYVTNQIRPDRACHAAIAGGDTPRPILKILAQRDLAWNRVVFVPTDERLVSPYHPASNYGMIQNALEQTPALIQPLDQTSIPSSFNFVWLGMALDGKVASLFSPADIGQDTTHRLVRTCPAPNSGHVPVARDSLSLAAILAADEIIVVIRGHAKRRLVELAIDGLVDMPIAYLFGRATSPIRIFWTL